MFIDLKNLFRKEKCRNVAKLVISFCLSTNLPSDEERFPVPQREGKEIQKCIKEELGDLQEIFIDKFGHGNVLVQSHYVMDILGKELGSQCFL